MEERSVSMPLLGDEFPHLKVNTTEGVLHLPEDFKGKWFVLFSHPADFTPVCTTEFVGFQEKIDEFDAMGVKLIGMSVDQVFSHIKWIEWIKEKLDVDITFPIIAANDAIALRLGMLHPGKGTNTVRAVFVVDPNAKNRLILYYPQEIGRNMDEIVRATRALITADKNNVAMPANWPHNTLIGDHVIIPPPSNRKDIPERLAKFDGYDWWFQHRKLAG